MNNALYNGYGDPPDTGDEVDSGNGPHSPTTPPPTRPRTLA